MATYTKTLKTLAITVIGENTDITVADTADNSYASNALAEFEAYQTMHVWVDNEGTLGLLLIPFHAVSSIAVSTTTTSVEKADAYGCDDNESAGD